MFPPIPDWDSMHPLVVHFPIVLLLIAPLFVVAGLALRDRRQTLLYSALVLMALGTIATFVATATGEAAGEVAERTMRAGNLIEQHEHLAELTRNVFLALTVAFGGILAVPRFVKHRSAGAISIGLTVAFLGFYIAGAVLLANTAHQGGQLVHAYGVRATVAVDTQPAATTEGARTSSGDHDADD